MKNSILYISMLVNLTFLIMMYYKSAVPTTRMATEKIVSNTPACSFSKGITRDTIFFKHFLLPEGCNIFLGEDFIAACNWSELFNRTDIFNRGVANTGTFDLISVASQIANAKPDSIFLWTGLNDLICGRPMNLIIGNIGTLIDTLTHKNPDVKIFVLGSVSIPFANQAETTNFIQTIDTFNEKLARLCQESSCKYIDMSEIKTYSDDGNICYDVNGIWLNPQVYQKIKNLLEPFFNNAFNEKQTK